MKKHKNSESDSAQNGSKATMEKQPKSESRSKGPLFSYENEVILMEELLSFRQEFGAVNKWRLFHERSQLKHMYTDSQISELMRRFKRNFDINNPPPPDADPKKVRIFELSKALWGSDPQQGNEAAVAASAAATAAAAAADTTTAAATAAVAASTKGKRKRSGEQPSPKPKREVPINPKEFPLLSECFGDVKVPELLRCHWGLMGSEAALDFEQQLTKLKEAETSLSLKALCLMRDMCLMLSEIIHRDVLAVQSSSSGEDEHAHV